MTLHNGDYEIRRLGEDMPENEPAGPTPLPVIVETVEETADVQPEPEAPAETPATPAVTEDAADENGAVIPGDPEDDSDVQVTE